MAIEKVREYFKSLGIEDKIMEFDVSSATVELAAQALGCEPARIAKTMALKVKDDENSAILIVAAGDAKIDNRRFKDEFAFKATMLSGEETQRIVGHAPGGVCPFAVPERLIICLDRSLERFNTVFPACGSASSAVELTCDELYKYSKATRWVDVCKGWRPEERT